MTWHWYILITIVRILFLFSPFKKDLSNEFPFPDDEWDEVKEYSNATNCIALLISFPVFLYITILAEADKVHTTTGINPLVAVIYLSGIICLSLLVFRFPPEWFRGERSPYYWLGGIIILEFIINVFLLNHLVAGLKP
jgi:hypothetical protein